MNYKKLGIIMGKIMILEGIMMFAPLIVSIIYKESFIHKLAFIVPITLLLIIGFALQTLKPTRKNLYQKEGFALTSSVWLIMTLFGAIPFVINKEIPNYIDACFEIMSGFTTTGASIVNDITLLSHSALFWRSFTHWIGGMGILVFVLIFIPESNDGSSMHLLRAESPGPQVGKIVSKLKVTTRILYLIYLGLTVLEIIVLMLDKPIAGYENEKLFFSILATFGCAGTGGFGFIPNSIELFNPFSQYVMATFLFLFGCNFSLYYLILIGKIKDIFKSEEFKTYVLTALCAIGFIFVGLLSKYNAYPQTYSVEEAFRHSYFQVASLMTTAGYTTTDYNLWPTLCQSTLFVLMLVGAMAGSTAGGLKMSRIVIALKGIYINIRSLINPRYVPKAKFEGKSLDKKTMNDVFSFITLYSFIMIAVIFLLSFDPVNNQTFLVVSDAGEYTQKHGFFSNFSATLSCLSNIGPGFEAIGPYSSFDNYNYFSKILLTFTMLIGRLEILPVLILFNKKTWKKI